jgi:phosphatidylglycerophosphate synthase
MTIENFISLIFFIVFCPLFIILVKNAFFNQKQTKPKKEK